jgi:DNA (cytosine-5)-methyltransferase 1
MTSHPNRGPKGPFSSPAPESIRQAREAAGLTQTQAAHLIHGTMRAWQEWEAGNRRMHAGLWELFIRKTRGPV